MELRLHPRSSTNYIAWVQFGEIPPLATTTGNVSADGMLLKLTHPALTPTSVVNVVMEDDVNQRAWSSRAMVIHSSKSGTGVLLLNALPAAMTESPQVAAA